MLPPQSSHYHFKIYKIQNPGHSLAHFLLLLVNTMLKICLLFIVFTKQGVYSAFLIAPFPVLVELPGTQYRCVSRHALGIWTHSCCSSHNRMVQLSVSRSEAGKQSLALFINHNSNRVVLYAPLYVNVRLV